MYSSNNTSDIVENNKRKNIEQSIEGVQSLLLGHFETLQQQIKDLEKRKEVLSNVTKVIDVSVIPDPITLNIGGFKHQTTKATLTKIPNSFFDLMLSGEIDIKPMTNKPNTYFIDRDGTHFNYILNYLRDEGDIQIPEDIRHCVRKEMEFFKINDHFKLDDTTTIIDQINSLKEKLDETEQALNATNQELALTKEDRKKDLQILMQVISLKYKDKDYKLLEEFNNSDASVFHSACNGKGATITLIETTDGCVFGGYNSQSWNSSSCYNGDNKCFIFTLVNKHGIPPTKYLPKENERYLTLGHKCFGPVFGNKDGFDLFISEVNSSQHFPAGYIDTTGKGKTTLTPLEIFFIKNIEIYKCN
ncbi:hypothetical protein CYY_007388 [Polysphondylium violaceum]|uniref:TLDc domain-containing protein n=1 Tax=Polysphondylium violaceum TaxID=133409 RepID=A0A8J4PRY7_9MYCE|nr:hypothetical protein CYY_007388 [Polysphondylium violaceum]